MDFDYSVLTDTVHKIKIYENGFAHLKLDDVIMHATTIIWAKRIQSIIKIT